LELRLVRRWNEFHTMISETGTGMRNVQEGKTLHVVEPKSRDSETRCVGQLRVWFGKKETVNGVEGRTRKGFCIRDFLCIFRMLLAAQNG